MSAWRAVFGFEEHEVVPLAYVRAVYRALGYQQSPERHAELRRALAEAEQELREDG